MGLTSNYPYFGLYGVTTNVIFDMTIRLLNAYTKRIFRGTVKGMWICCKLDFLTFFRFLHDKKSATYVKYFLRGTTTVWCDFFVWYD